MTYNKQEGAIMKVLIPKSLFISAALLLTSGVCMATTSVVQLSVGNITNCSSLTSSNSVVQVKDTSYSTGLDGFDHVTGGPANDQQEFRYKLTASNGINNNRIEWEVVSPDPLAAQTTAKRIAFIILKQQGNTPSVAAYYVQPGVYQDIGVTTGTSITGVTFCYGLSAPSTASMPLCEATEDCNNLAGRGIRARIITKFDEPDNNTSNWTASSCACSPIVGQQNFKECDPTLPAGTPGACTKSAAENGELIGLPIEVQLGRDPDSYYCLVLYGSRVCWSK